ncbi:hypothetical protein B0H10DRAFT_2080347 [Mycena sp. CBHHK59/15]|nr:hypothetical protein B0H10DRAFT_2080347 [Mycena sp. CBHHK59/15]
MAGVQIGLYTHPTATMIMTAILCVFSRSATESVYQRRGVNHTYMCVCLALAETCRPATIRTRTSPLWGSFLAASSDTLRVGFVLLPALFLFLSARIASDVRTWSRSWIQNRHGTPLDPARVQTEMASRG